MDITAHLLSAAAQAGRRGQPEPGQDQPLPVFDSAIEHFTANLALAQRSAILSAARNVDYIVATCRLLRLRHPGGLRRFTPGTEQYQQLGRIHDLAAQVQTVAISHSVTIEAISAEARSTIAAIDAAIRGHHPYPGDLTYKPPIFIAPEQCREIGQTRVEAALAELDHTASEELAS